MRTLPDNPRPPLVVIIPTHTTRHLRRTLLGVSCQTRRADLTVVSCDNDGKDLRELVAQCATEFALHTLLVQRAFTGSARSGQVRNNAVRGLLRDVWPNDTRLVFLDGDCCPAPEVLATHETLAAAGRNGLVVGHRFDLTEEQATRFDETAIRAGRWPVQVTDDQVAALRSRDARYRRQVMLRRFGLTKAHKPKVLSANFSVSLKTYLDINGFDESYEGYGQEDDDFGRRAYTHGDRPIVGVRSLPVFHLYHPTRAPEAWDRSPNARKFLREARGGRKARCTLGVDHSAEQGPLIIELFGKIEQNTDAPRLPRA